MSDKTKRKSNPRRRLLLRLLLGIGIIAILGVFLVKQFEPEHLYLVYESRDEDTLASNLYLYDVTLGETVRQITNNADRDTNFLFDTARNAPYLVYQQVETSAYEFQTGEAPLFLVDLSTSKEMLLSDRVQDGVFSIHPNGGFVAYQENTGFERISVTHLINLSTNEDIIAHEFDYVEFDFAPLQRLYWTDTSLMIALRFRSATDVFDYFVHQYDLETGEIKTLETSFIEEEFSFPIISPNGTLMSYYSNGDTGSYTIIDALDYEYSDIPHISYEASQGELLDTYPLIWHPDSENLVIATRFNFPLERSDDLQTIFSGDDYSHYALLNIETQEIRYFSNEPHFVHINVPQWNWDGSYAVYIRGDRRCISNDAGCYPIVMWDMENGHENVLPLSGWIIDWVRIP